MSLVPFGTQFYRPSYVAALAEGFRMVGDESFSAEQLSAAAAAPDGFFADHPTPSLDVKLPNGTTIPRPPTTAMWWIGEAEFVGSIYLHHELDPYFVAKYVGHVVYAVRPSHRNKGHATRMLCAILPLASSLGFRQLSLCVRASNAASRRVIEANGGSLMDEVHIPYDRNGELMRRYVIDIGGRNA